MIGEIIGGFPQDVTKMSPRFKLCVKCGAKNNQRFKWNQGKRPTSFLDASSSKCDYIKDAIRFFLQRKNMLKVIFTWKTQKIVFFFTPALLVVLVTNMRWGKRADYYYHGREGSGGGVWPNLYNNAQRAAAKEKQHKYPKKTKETNVP